MSLWSEHCGCHAVHEHVRNWPVRVVRTGPLQTCWCTAWQPQCSVYKPQNKPHQVAAWCDVSSHPKCYGSLAARQHVCNGPVRTTRTGQLQTS